MKNKISLAMLFYCFMIIAVYPKQALSDDLSKSNSPLQLIQSLSQQLEEDLLKYQDEIKTKPLMTSELITKVLDSSVDFELMSRYVLGNNWKIATAQQKDEFILLFKALLIRFYTKAFNNFLETHRIEKGMITFLPFRAQPKSNYAKVNTEIKLNSAATKLNVQYSLYYDKNRYDKTKYDKTREKNEGWKIYDLSIEGISLVTSYRSSFKQIIKNEKLAGLIKHLENKLNNPEEKSEV